MPMKAQELTPQQIERVNRSFFPPATPRSKYPCTESRIEEAAILHGAEGQNYSRRRTTPGSTVIIHHKIPVVRPPKRRGARPKVIVERVDVVEHRHLTLWETGLVHHHDRERTHEISKSTVARRSGGKKRGLRVTPAWLVKEIDALPPKRVRKPKLPYRAMAERFAEIAAREPKPKREKKLPRALAFLITIAELMEYHRPKFLALPAPAPEPETPSLVATARLKIDALLASF